MPMKIKPERNPTETEKHLRDLANSYLKYLEDSNQHRSRPEWDEQFMRAAYEVGERSSCLFLKTGAVVVHDKRIRSAGYNGAPPKIENCLKRGCRKLEKRIEFNQKGTGNCRGVHAEKNAMDQIARENLIGCSLYTVFFPCSVCAKEIVANGISEVFYSIKYGEADSLTTELFQEAGVRLKQLIPNLEIHYLQLKAIDNQRNNPELRGLV